MALWLKIQIGNCEAPDCEYYGELQEIIILEEGMHEPEYRWYCPSCIFDLNR